jgi:hypothetical protein
VRQALGFLHSRGFHLTMVVLWATLLLPTLLWWKDSILWVASMSLYANVAAHWASYQGARAEHQGSSPAPPGKT